MGMDESRTRQERGANKEFFHIVYPCLSSSKELIECILVSGELLTDRACQAGIRQAKGDLTVVSYLTVKTVLGKYTTRILLDVGYIIPAGKDARRISGSGRTSGFRSPQPASLAKSARARGRAD